MQNDTHLIIDYKNLQERVKLLEKENAFLREQFNLSQHRQFGASSEQNFDQGALFNEPEEISEELEPETVAKNDTKSCVKRPKREPLPKNLPRETRTIDIADDDKICTCCNADLHRFGEEKSEQLEYVPASLKVIETVRLKYACRACEKTATKTPIKISLVPPAPIPKSIATPSLLSQIIIQKYQFALPLYRQEAIFAQLDIKLSRKTMANWMIRCAELLSPVFDRLKHHLLEQTVIHADETPLKVIHEDKQKSYMWVYCSGSDSSGHESVLKNIVLYDYHASRASTCPKEFLEGYSGYLQVDGYAGYNDTSATLVGCMAHARRKFVEAQRAQAKGKTGRADWAVNHIQKLYRIESSIKDLPEQERLSARREKSRPLLDEFKVWLDKTALTTAPKTAIGKAASYTLGQWHKLERYCEDGQLNIDNNRAERAIKPFVIGRKNWLFSNTERGANASAMLYSMIESAKANGLNCQKYIEGLLSELPKRGAGDCMDDLMPWVFSGKQSR
jgi:transposase